MIISKAIYFPYTDISTDRLAGALSFFRQIILYRLPEDQPSPELAAAEARGLVDMQEVTFIRDLAEVRHIVSDFSRWADDFRDPSFLAVLQRYSREAKTRESPSKLTDAIRRYESVQQSLDEQARTAQIFLHFIRVLNRQKSEIDELIGQVENKHSRLMDILSGEEESTEPEAIVAGPTGRDESGLEFLPQRLTAWGWFHEAFGPAGIPLFTDRPEAVDYMDQKLARTRPRPSIDQAGPTEVLEPFVEIGLPVVQGPMNFQNLEARSLELIERLGPDWTALLERVCTEATPREALSELRQAFKQIVSEAGLAVTGQDVSENHILRGYLLPGTDLKSAYSEAVGLGRRRQAIPIHIAGRFSKSKL